MSANRLARASKKTFRGSPAIFLRRCGRSASHHWRAFSRQIIIGSPIVAVRPVGGGAWLDGGVLDDRRWKPIAAVAQCLHRPTLPAVRGHGHNLTGRDKPRGVPNSLSRSESCRVIDGVAERQRGHDADAWQPRASSAYSTLCNLVLVSLTARQSGRFRC